MPTSGLKAGSLNELYFWLAEYAVIAVPWSVVQVVVVLVVVWAEARLALARKTEPVTIEKSDLLIIVSLRRG